MLQEKSNSEQHADGDKKETREDIPKWQDVPEGLVAVFGFGDDQARQEGTEGQGETGFVGQPGDGHAQGYRCDQEQLPASGFCDCVKDSGYEPLGQDRDEKNDPDDLRGEQDGGNPLTLRCSCQEWD